MEQRDINGRPVAPGRWARLRERLGGGPGDGGIDVADTGLIVVAESVDDAAASSTVLAASAWRPEDQVVLRHALRLPADRVADAVATAGLDEYRRVDTPAHPFPDTGASGESVAFGASGVSGASGSDVVVVLARVQLLDAVHLSQERSRMASLGSRHGGSVIGWQILQRPPG
ncbi:hypothetical protein ACWDTI_06185 [Gordonia sp. NPDC003424]